MANVAKRLINIDRKLLGVATSALLPLLTWSTPLSAEPARIRRSMPVAVEHSEDGMYYVDPELRPFPISPTSTDPRQNFLVEKFDDILVWTKRTLTGLIGCAHNQFSARSGAQIAAMVLDQMGDWFWQR